MAGSYTRWMYAGGTPSVFPLFKIFPLLSFFYIGGSEFETPIPYWEINNELFSMGTPLV